MQNKSGLLVTNIRQGRGAPTPYPLGGLPHCGAHAPEVSELGIWAFCYHGSRWWQSGEECARRSHKGGKLWWPHLSFSPSSTDNSAVKQVVCLIRNHAAILYILIYSPDINLQIFSMLG